MVTDFMDIYIKNISDLEGKTIKIIDTGFCNEGLYIITEDGKWTLFEAEDSIEIVTDENDIEYNLFKGNCIVSDLEKHTLFNYEAYKNEKLNQAQAQLDLNREKHQQEEITLLKKLMEKYEGRF